MQSLNRNQWLSHPHEETTSFPKRDTRRIERERDGIGRNHERGNLWNQKEDDEKRKLGFCAMGARQGKSGRRKEARNFC